MPQPSPAPFNIADEFVSRPAREHPGRHAILGVERQATYAQLASEVSRVAHALRDSNCQPGDRVLIVLPDSIEFIAAFFGAAKIGAIAVPVNSMARAADYRHYLSNSGARIAIVHHSALPEFLSGIEWLSLDRLVMAGGEGRKPENTSRAFTPWADWIPARSSDVETFPTTLNDPAFFLYTSGSGGSPKAAVHRHEDMLATSRGFAQGVLGLRSDDRTFSVSKLFFAYGLGNGMYFPFAVGASTILDPDRPSPLRVTEIIDRHRPTVFFSVPTFYASLLREEEKGLRVDFSSVRLAVSAGESLPEEIFLRFRDRFGLEIIDGIGSTEMLHMFLSSRPGAARPGSCGREVPGYEARLLDDAGNAVAPGDIGNLWVKGASALAEYWRIPELTARTKQDGWVLTGDKFTRDAEGYYRYCGRADDMMKVSGMWVSPGEVENALLAYPAVAEAAVVGATDEMGITRTIAFVVLRSGVTQPAGGLDSEIHAWLRTRLVGYKCPHDIRFVAELPKTATGKIQRFRLRSSGA
ncbi:MAG: benzoate-CoA ligase family protein [Candidatus Acidiferrales bacterium]